MDRQNADGGIIDAQCQRNNAAFEAALAEARALPLEAALLGHRLKRVGGELVGPCPVCGGRDRFGVNPRKRVWKCRDGNCGEGGNDAISLAMHVAQCDFLAAVELLTGTRPRHATRTPRDPSTSRRRPTQANADEAARNARHLSLAKRLVSEMTPLARTPGEAYLADVRGIDVKAIADVLKRSDAIGWHPEVYFGQPYPDEPLHEFDGRRLWCIVGVMTDPVTAEPTGGISRTYLDPSTRKKVGKAKSLGVPAGIVRLSPDEDVAEGLCIAEGLETALAGMAIGLVPMWSTGTTSLMRSLPVLPGVGCLTIVADHDANRAGEHAAQELAARYRAAKLEARILRPKALGDLNDAVMGKGP
jgi:phage/plasmid primase-like uncharacterized protein